MIRVDVLSTFRGHKPIYVEDPKDDAERARLASRVRSLMKDGYDLFLIDEDRITRRIKDYDSKNNEWLLFSRRVATPSEPETGTEVEKAKGKKRDRTRKEERVAADGTTAGAVARTAGG